MYYNYFRYYQPGIGRYLRPDPIGLESQINIYVYVLNNPITLRDPEGNIAITTAISIGVSLVAVSMFLEQAIRSCQKAEEVRKKRERLLEEFEKGIPDPECAARLKRESDEEYIEFLRELEKTVEKGMKVPNVSTSP